MEVAPGDPRFTRTRWSLVAAAGEGGSADAEAALAELCGRYWYPLYAFARRRGHPEHRAQDLVQGFFAALLEKRYLRDADREKGKFRTFLITAFRHYASKEREKAAAVKRGGRTTTLSLDFETGEHRYRLEIADGSEDPERAYERRWALTVLDEALVRLSDRYAGEGKETLLDALRPFLTAGSPLPPQREVAERLGMSTTAVRVAVHRLRGRYRQELRGVIAETVADPSSIDDEILHLMEAVAG